MSEDNKKIEDSFNDFFKEQTPPDLWKAIDNSLGNDEEVNDFEFIESCFMSSYDQEPKAEIWDNINEELNIDLVWSKLTSTLDELKQKDRKRNRIFKFTSLALLLLFLHTCSNYINYEGNNANRKLISEKNSKGLNRKNTPQLDIVPKSDKTSGNLPEKTQNFYNTSKKRTEPGNSKNSNNTFLSNSNYVNRSSDLQKNISNDITSSDLDLSQNNTLKQEVNLLSTSLNTLSLNENNVGLSALSIASIKPDKINNNLPDSFSSVLNNKNPKNFKFKNIISLEIGLISTLGTTIFLNYETLNAINPRNSIATSLLLTQGNGLTTQLSMNSRHKIGFDLFIWETSAQRYYKYTTAGNYLQHDIEVNYTKINLFHKCVIPLIPTKLFFFTKTGTSLSILQSENNRINSNNSKALATHFTNADLGLNLTLGSSFETGRFVFDCGLFTEVGLLNVNKGSDIEPARFKSTHILDLGAMLSVRYRFYTITK